MGAGMGKRDRERGGKTGEGGGGAAGWGARRSGEHDDNSPRGVLSHPIGGNRQKAIVGRNPSQPPRSANNNKLKYL